MKLRLNKNHLRGRMLQYGAKCNKQMATSNTLLSLSRIPSTLVLMLCLTPSLTLAAVNVEVKNTWGSAYSPAPILLESPIVSGEITQTVLLNSWNVSGNTIRRYKVAFNATVSTTSDQAWFDGCVQGSSGMPLMLGVTFVPPGTTTLSFNTMALYQTPTYSGITGASSKLSTWNITSPEFASANSWRSFDLNAVLSGEGYIYTTTGSPGTVMVPGMSDTVLALKDGERLELAGYVRRSGTGSNSTATCNTIHLSGVDFTTSSGEVPTPDPVSCEFSVDDMDFGVLDSNAVQGARETTTLSGICSADASISARVKGTDSGTNVLNLDGIFSTLTFSTTGTNAITFNAKQGAITPVVISGVLSTSGEVPSPGERSGNVIVDITYD